jgi:DNA-binding CsgD family transcriptional regulator
MGKSQRLSGEQQRAVMRLVGECRDLAHDSDLWHRHCLERLRNMLNAFTATGGEGIWLRPGNPVNPRQVISVGMSPNAERLFRQFVQKEHKLPTDPFFAALSLQRQKLITFRRAQLVNDDDWYSASSVMDLRRLAGSDDVLNTTLQFRSDGTTNVLTLQRAWGEQPFSERDRVMLHLFHQELSPLIGGVLATIDVPGVRGLPPRVGQTLQLLLHGMSYKEIAGRLHIKQETVSEYIAQLKMRFSVRTTPELLSAYLGRNRLQKPDITEIERN